MELTERKNRILRSVVEHYIVTGEPLGSKQLCGSLNVSSATVRNEMSDLSEIGLLEQTHTSSGRIPSDRGYRYYIEHLMADAGLSRSDRFAIRSAFTDITSEPAAILRKAVQYLAELSDCACVATTPFDENATIRHIELVPIGDRSALVIVVVSTGTIKTGLCRLEEKPDLRTAEVFYRICATAFQDKRANDVSLSRLQTIASGLGDRMLSILPLLFSVAELANQASKPEVLSAGQENLLRHPELEVDKFALYDFLQDPHMLIRYLQSGHNDMTIRIGSEIGVQALRHTSILRSQYKVNDRPFGCIAVLGPTRMNYPGIIPTLAYLCRIIGEMFRENTAL